MTSINKIGIAGSWNGYLGVIKKMVAVVKKSGTNIDNHKKN